MGIILIPLFLSFSGCLTSTSVDVRELSNEPDEYINMTEEMMNEYLPLKESIITGKYVETTYDENHKIWNFFREHRNIKYQGKYYRVMCSTT